jgi:predicted MFS family arabinose efflux permease
MPTLSLHYFFLLATHPGACFLTYWTTTYWELYICRAATGFSVGGALPLIYSLLGDLFPSHERHKVNAAVGMGTGLGISLGQGIAGFFGPTFGWRMPFLVVSLPALTCATMVYLTVQEPVRGQMEQVYLEQQQQSSLQQPIDDINNTHNNMKELEMQHLKPKENNSALPPVASLGLRRRSPSIDRKNRADSLSQGDNSQPASVLQQFYRRRIAPTLSALRVLCQTPTVMLALFQGAPGCLPWGIVNTYLTDFLAEDRGMSVEFATFTVLWFGLGNFFGLIVGGAGGQYLYRVDKRYPALLAGSMAIFGCAPFWVLLNGVNNNSSFVFIANVALIAGAAAGVTGPIIKATLQNVTLPTMRGQAFALMNTFDDFGRGLGPVFLALLITSAGGRTPAFNLGTMGWVMCGILNIAVFFTAERDERRVQATLAANTGTASDSHAFA